MSAEENRDPWGEMGVPPDDVEGWQQLGFGPFEAALAQGDGYTAFNSVHSRHQLLKTAAGWRNIGLDNAEGRRWHRAGFAPRQVSKYLQDGVTLEMARGQPGL